ncbi:MAG TPA: MFS transporter [Solirubrobacterales bacterium]|nr:MFS transporter [Solirubrobacterales bacterium]
MTDLLLAAPAEPTPSPRARRLGLAGICFGFLMITIDTTAVNVALGPIVADLGGSLAAAQWIVSGYTLVFATFLLSGGAWADRIGSRTAFLIGLGVFGLASAACAAAPSMDALIAARAAQGLGAALLMPCSLALIVHTFPAGPPRRGALAAWGGISGVGLSIGPVLGGALIDSVGWRFIFVVNLPLAVAAGLAIAGHVTETTRHRHPFDVPGQVLVVAALGCLSGGFILAGEIGWTAAGTIGLLVAGVAAALALARVERLVPLPMIPPALFRNRKFRNIVLVAGLYNFGFYGTLFCLSLYLHERLGLSPFDTGLALLPLTAIIGAIALYSGRLIARLGEWRAVLIGLGFGAAGAALMAAFGSAGVAGTILFSIPFAGQALTMQAMTALAMEDVPRERVGLASGVQNAARQAGGALGVALLGTLLAAGGHLSLHLPMAVVSLGYLASIWLALTGRRHAAHR